MTSPVSSTPVLRTTLVWSGIATAVLAIAGAGVGYAVAEANGMWSALAGVLIAAVFLAITAASILIANRWYGDALYVQLFFGIVLGGWLLKFVVFFIALLVLRGQPWIVPMVFFLALVASVIASLAVDVVAMLRTRMPNVSDLVLPGEGEDAAGDTLGSEGDVPNPSTGRQTDPDQRDDRGSADS